MQQGATTPNLQQLLHRRLDHHGITTPLREQHRGISSQRAHGVHHDITHCLKIIIIMKKQQMTKISQKIVTVELFKPPRFTFQIYDVEI